MNYLGSSLPRNQKRHFGGVVNARACYSRKEISRTARSFGSESSNLSGVGIFFDFFAYLWAFFAIPSAILKCGGSMISIYSSLLAKISVFGSQTVTGQILTFLKIQWTLCHICLILQGGIQAILDHNRFSLFIVLGASKRVRF